MLYERRRQNPTTHLLPQRLNRHGSGWRKPYKIIDGVLDQIFMSFKQGKKKATAFSHRPNYYYYYILARKEALVSRENCEHVPRMEGRSRSIFDPADSHMEEWRVQSWVPQADSLSRMPIARIVCQQGGSISSIGAAHGPLVMLKSCMINARRRRKTPPLDA